MNRYLIGQVTALLLCFTVGFVAFNLNWNPFLSVLLAVIVGACTELYFRK